MELTLKFLEKRLKQAQTDVELYGLMLAEIYEKLEKNKKTDVENKFLKVVSNKGVSDENE